MGLAIRELGVEPERVAIVLDAPEHILHHEQRGGTAE